MEQVHVRRKHVQAALTAREYASLRQAAEEAGISLQEAVRRAVVAWSLASGASDPFKRLIGKYQGDSDSSLRVDDIYDGF